MFRDRINSGPFLIRDQSSPKNSSFSPHVGDVASVIVDENDVQVQICLENNSGNEWSGKISSYQLKIEGLTPADRLEEIRIQEEFVEKNNLSNGSDIAIEETKIFSLSR